MKPLRIMLVDDHILFRRGVAAVLESRPYLEVVGEAGDGLEAIERAREVMPDVVFMDITMPRCGGLEAARLIKQDLPHVHIIMLTVSDRDRDLFEAIKCGASGYLLKNLDPAKLFEMLERLRAGEPPITGSLAAKILNEFRQPSQNNPTDPSNHLTGRERQVLELIVQGLTNKEIAESLSIAEDTVKIHLRNILTKLHLQNRIQAAVYAVRQGLVPETLEPQNDPQVEAN